MKCPLCKYDKYIIKVQYEKQALFEAYSGLGVNVDTFFPESLTGLRECPSCKLQYFYPSAEGDGSFYEKLSKLDWYYAQDKYEYDYAIKKILEIQPTSVLEVGCGSGFFLDKIRYAYDVRATEQNPAALEALNKKGISLDDGKQKYDLIVSFQVLEHIADPRTFLDTFVDRLNEGGYLLLTTPNPDSKYMKEVFQILDFPPHHITRWSKDAFLYLAKLYSMEVVDYTEEPISLLHYQQLIQARRNGLNYKQENPLLQDDVLLPYFLDTKEMPGHTHGMLYKK